MSLPRSNLLTTVAFLAGFVALTHALAGLSRWLAPDGDDLFLEHDRKQIRNLSSAAKNVEVITIGNSHNGSLAIAPLGLSGVEVTRPSSDLFETLYILKTVTPRLSRLKIVFMPISYFTFTWDAGASSETRIRRRHLYQTLNHWRPIPGDLGNFLAAQGERVFPVMEIVREDNFQDVFVGLLGGQVSRPDPVAIDDEFRFMKSDALGAQVRRRADRTLGAISEMRQAKPQLEQELRSCMREIIVVLRKRHVRPVFFTPPYAESYNRYYRSRHPELVAQMRRFMAYFQRRWNVDYYDFSHHPEISSRALLFADGDHLNALGRTEFSVRFRSALEDDVLKRRTYRQVASTKRGGRSRAETEK